MKPPVLPTWPPTMRRHAVRQRRMVATVALALIVSGCGSTVATRSSVVGVSDGSSAVTDGQGLQNTAPGAAPFDASAGSTGVAGGTAVATGNAATETHAPGAGPAGPVAVAPGSAGRGDSPSRAPIRVGFLATDFGNVGKSMGFSSSYDPQRGFKDLVTSLNAAGGLGGRPIRPDYYSVDPTTSGTGDQASQTACTHFSQDQHDELVVSVDVYSATLDGCLSAAHLPHFDAGYTYAPDIKAQRVAPSYFDPFAAGVDTYAAVELEAAVATRMIKRGDKVGIVVESCPQYLRTYDAVTVPTAQRLGLQLFSSQTICVNGAQDLGQEISEIQSAVVKFHSEGVTTVSALSQAEAVIAVYFAQNAENQGWRPQYLLTSVASPDRLVRSQGNSLSFPPKQLPGLHGLGWIPIADTGTGAAAASPQQNAQRVSCLSRSRTAGDSKTQTDGGLRSQGLALYLIECDTLLLLNNILAATGGRADLASLSSAFATAVDTFGASSTVDGRVHHVGARHDGIDAARPWAFNGACQCIKYVGPARKLQG